MEIIFTWGKFIRRIALNTAPPDVYSAIATADGLTQWFVKDVTSSSGTQVRDRNEPFQKNDTYKWTWYYKDFILEGSILEANNRDFIQFTFGSSVVSLKIIPGNNATLLELVQTEENSNAKTQLKEIDCFATWTFFLTNLKATLEKGVDLREKKPLIEGLVNR